MTPLGLYTVRDISRLLCYSLCAAHRCCSGHMPVHCKICTPMWSVQTTRGRRQPRTRRVPTRAVRCCPTTSRSCVRTWRGWKPTWQRLLLKMSSCASTKSTCKPCCCNPTATRCNNPASTESVFATKGATTGAVCSNVGD